MALHTFKALYEFQAMDEDELDLQASDLIDVEEIHSGEWGQGVSRRTQKKGLFPWSYVEQHTSTEKSDFKFDLIAVSQPVMCWHTKDFVWGHGAEAYFDTVFGFTCQKRSRFFVENDRAYETVRPGRAVQAPPNTPIESWNVEDVQLFMIAAKLEMYEAIFVQNKITGPKLKALNHKKLQSLGVEDTGHRTMIDACIKELTTGETKTAEYSFSQRCNLAITDPLDDVEKMDFLPMQAPGDLTKTVKGHSFRLQSFAKPAWCDYSRKLLFGLVRQGLKCTTCGYIVAINMLDEVPSCSKKTQFPMAAVPPGVAVGHMFGVPVQGQILHGRLAPTLVEKCVAAIENGNGLKTANLYRKFAPVNQRVALQAELLSNADTTLDGRDPLLLTSLLMRYFDELPEPLVPFEWYDRIVAGAMLPTEDERVAEIDSVVSNISGGAATTLSYLLGHLGRVLANAKATKIDPGQLGLVWGPLILRPRPEERSKNITDRDAQSMAVQLLVAKCHAGGAHSSLTAPALLPRKSKSIKRKNKGHVQSNYENVTLPGQAIKPTSTKKPVLPPKPDASDEIYVSTRVLLADRRSLEKEPWFAGNMDRTEAERTIADLVDGSYLVRRSQSRHGHTLTVKFRVIRHIVLLEKDGMFGFAPDCLDFASIPALIRHFEKHSLKKYNHELETVLAFPFRDARKESDEIEYDDMNQDIYVSNIQELRQNMKRNRGDWRQDGATVAHFDKRMKDLEKQIKAHEAVIRLLEEQSAINLSKQKMAQDKDKELVLESYTQITRLISGTKEEMQRLNKELAHVADEERAFREQETQQDDTLAEEDESAPAPPALQPRRTPSASQSTPVYGAEGAVPKEEASDYYVGFVSRDAAERDLRGLPPGTFLIRRSDRPVNPYTLSLSYKDNVKHIQIKSNGQMFGLAEPLAFPRLDQLVEYYQSQELSASIKSTLKHPFKKARGTR